MSPRASRKREYFWSYLGHVAQGFILCLLTTPLLGAFIIAQGYYQYQRIEYQRFKDARDTRWYNEGPGQRDAKPEVDDWPSRDIADFMIGGWCAMAAWGIGLAVALVKLL